MEIEAPIDGLLVLNNQKACSCVQTSAKSLDLLSVIQVLF